MCVFMHGKDIAAPAGWLQPHPKALQLAASTCIVSDKTFVLKMLLFRSFVITKLLFKGKKYIKVESGLYLTPLCFIYLLVDIYSLQLGGSAMVGGLELSPSQIICWFPQEATGPRCSRPKPLDSKHDPSPLIFFLGGGR